MISRAPVFLDSLLSEHIIRCHTFPWGGSFPVTTHSFSSRGVAAVRARRLFPSTIPGVRGSVPVLPLGRKLDWQPVLSPCPEGPAPTTLAKKIVTAEKFMRLICSSNHVISCDIELRFDIVTGTMKHVKSSVARSVSCCGGLAAAARRELALQIGFQSMSHDITWSHCTSQSHEFFGCNETTTARFFVSGQGSSRCSSLAAAHSFIHSIPGFAASHSSKDPPSLAYWLFASPQ